MNLIKQLVYVKLDFIFYDNKNGVDGFIDSFSLSTGTSSLEINMLSTFDLSLSVFTVYTHPCFQFYSSKFVNSG